MISHNSSHDGGVSTPRCGASSRLMWAVILLGCIWDGKVDARDTFVAATPSSWAVPAFLAGRCLDFSAASPVAFRCVLAANLLTFPVGLFVVFVAALLGRFLEGVALLLKKWRGPIFQFYLVAAMVAKIVERMQEMLTNSVDGVVLMEYWGCAKENFSVPMDYFMYVWMSIFEVLFDRVRVEKLEWACQEEHLRSPLGHCPYCKDVLCGPYGQDVSWLGMHCASPQKKASGVFEVFLRLYGQTRTDLLSRLGAVEWSSSCAFGVHRSFGKPQQHFKEF